MSQLADQIKLQMNQLSHDDLEELLSHLVDLLDPGIDPDADAAWDAEIRRRVAEVESGADEGIDADEVRRMARQRLEKKS